MPFARFLSSETGAVAVDWVALTAGLVGLGLATLTVVSGGVEALSRDVDASLSDQSILTRFREWAQISSFDFSGGVAVGWVGGQVRDMGGQIGELLVIGPRQTVGYVIDIAQGTETAVMSFDLVAGDSLDGEQATMMLNGVPIAIATSTHNTPMTFQIPQLDGTTVEATVIVGSARIGGVARWDDSVATVTVTVDRPTEDLQFQVSSNANQNINDEFWGIDNFEAATQ